MGIRHRLSVPADHFTIIRNDWLRDERLSWKARGLVAYLASHRVGWETSLEQLARAGKDGKDSVAAGLKELADLGYLKVERQRDRHGKLSGTDYDLTDPWIEPKPDFPEQAKPEQAKPVLANPLPKKTSSSEDHLEEHQGELLPVPASPSEFESWYNQYPKKVKRFAAEKAFKAARKRASMGELVTGLERYKARIVREKKTSFWMDPSTWLNGGCWLDEPEVQHQQWQRPAGVQW